MTCTLLVDRKERPFQFGVLTGTTLNPPEPAGDICPPLTICCL
jgi:hypothetical protein